METSLLEARLVFEHCRQNPSGLHLKNGRITHPEWDAHFEGTVLRSLGSYVAHFGAAKQVRLTESTRDALLSIGWSGSLTALVCCFLHVYRMRFRGMTPAQYEAHIGRYMIDLMWSLWAQPEYFRDVLIP